MPLPPVLRAYPYPYQGGRGRGGHGGGRSSNSRHNADSNNNKNPQSNGNDESANDLSGVSARHSPLDVSDIDEIIKHQRSSSSRRFHVSPLSPESNDKNKNDDSGKGGGGNDNFGRESPNRTVSTVSVSTLSPSSNASFVRENLEVKQEEEEERGMPVPGDGDTNTTPVPNDEEDSSDREDKKAEKQSPSRVSDYRDTHLEDFQGGIRDKVFFNDDFPRDKKEKEAKKGEGASHYMYDDEHNPHPSPSTALSPSHNTDDLSTVLEDSSREREEEDYEYNKTDEKRTAATGAPIVTTAAKCAVGENVNLNTTAPPSSAQTEAERLNALASDLLGRGRDDEALDAYKRAMHVARAELMRLKRLIGREISRQKSQEGGRGQEEADYNRKQGNINDDGKDGQRHPTSPGRYSLHKKSPDRKRSSTHHHDLTKLNESVILIASTIADLRNNMGVVYEMQGKYDDAIACCRDAIDVYHNTCNRFEMYDPDVERTVQNLMQVELARDTAPERRKLHDHADRLLKKAVSVTNPHAKRGLRGDALTTLRTALHLERDSLGPGHPQVAETLLTIGRIHCEGGNIIMGIRQMNAALSILRSSLGDKHPKLGQALLDLAAVHDEFDNDKDTALELYLEGVSVLRSSHGESHPRIAPTLNNVGVLYYNRGQFDEAMSTFSDALLSYGVGRTDDEHDTTGGVNPETAHVWNNIGEVYTKRGQWDDALHAYLSALSVLLHAKQCVVKGSVAMGGGQTDDNGAGHGGKHVKSQSLTTAAAVSVGGGRGRHVRSQSLASAATTGSSSSTSSAITKQSTAESERVIALTRRNVGLAYTALGRYDKAMEMYQEALRTHRTAEMTARGRRERWERSSGSAATGSSAGSEGRQASQDASQAAIAVAVADVAAVLQSMGEVQECCGNLSKAMALYNESLQLRRDKKPSSNGEDSVEIATLLMGMGSVHLKRNEYDEGAMVLRESVRLLNANGLPPDHDLVIEAKSRLAKAEKVDRRSTSLSSSPYLRGSKVDSSPKPLGPAGGSSDPAVNFDDRARALYKRRDYNGALQAYVAALRIRRERMAARGGMRAAPRGIKERNDIARTLSNIAKVHFARRDVEQAEVLYKEVLSIYKANGVPDKHPYVLEVSSALDSLNACSI